MIQMLLVAYDGSKEANSAFQFGLELAKKYGARMKVLAVARPPEPPAMVETSAVLEYATEHYQELFKKLKEQARKARVRITTEVAVGHPAEQILHWAEQIHVDVIVMGHQTRSALGRWFLGSVANRVIDHARCTVMVVKGQH
jgi:nucleotide-binding universal stress UspA family protein